MQCILIPIGQRRVDSVQARGETHAPLSTERPSTLYRYGNSIRYRRAGKRSVPREGMTRRRARRSALGRPLNVARRAPLDLEYFSRIFETPVPYRGT